MPKVADFPHPLTSDPLTLPLGVWIRPSVAEDPTTTVFGSTNLNSRSANLDTELSFILHTQSDELRSKLGAEVDYIWTHSQKVDDNTWAEPHRAPSLSTHLIVALVEKML
jgi:CDP-diacylglycerol---glycerol-3-phosphate 3-phosphatidyltransferase